MTGAQPVDDWIPMNAVFFSVPGAAAQVLAYGDMPLPKPAAGEALIEVKARPMQPADFAFIAGRYRIRPSLPQVAGLEGMGRIRISGAASPFREGERVAFRSPGSWADFAVAPLRRIYPVPDDIEDLAAAQFALNPITAFALLHESGAKPGSSVLVTAGRSQVARMIEAIAPAFGIHTVLVSRSGCGHSIRIGDAVAELAAMSPANAVRHATERFGPFDAVIDAVGGELVPALLVATRQGGRIVQYGLLDPSAFSLRAADLIYGNLRLSGFGIDWWLDRVDAPTVTAATEAAWALMRSRPELFAPSEVCPLSRFDAAVAQASSGPRRSGKVILAT